MPADGDLEATYRGYEGAGGAGGRWSSANAGNRAIHAERNAAFAAALATRPVGRLLEVGCGDGTLLRELQDMVPAVACTGVELLGFRLAEAAPGGPPLVQADGQHLPFPSAAFDVVVLSTVLSSVGDDAVALGIAAEVQRVLAPGGALLWYDMRLPNPANRAIRPIGRRRLRALFPALRGRVRSVTLVPQVARRLGGVTPRAYPVLARLPFLRSHLFAVLAAPAAQPRARTAAAIVDAASPEP